MPIATCCASAAPLTRGRLRPRPLQRHPSGMRVGARNQSLAPGRLNREECTRMKSTEASHLRARNHPTVNRDRSELMEETAIRTSGITRIMTIIQSASLLRLPLRRTTAISGNQNLTFLLLMPRRKDRPSIERNPHRRPLPKRSIICRLTPTPIQTIVILPRFPNGRENRNRGNDPNTALNWASMPLRRSTRATSTAAWAKESERRKVFKT